MDLHAPSTTNKYYISVDWTKYPGPGYNRCITYVDGSCLPNCVGYAWGRFMEIAGVKKCNLCRGNAKTWWGYTSDGYERGQKPKVGAVMCWQTNGQYGHVAIVEVVNADGSVVISESFDRGDYAVYDPKNPTQWKSQTIPTTNNYSTIYAKFQGFIYNPYLKQTTSASVIETTTPSSITSTSAGTASSENTLSDSDTPYIVTVGRSAAVPSVAQLNDLKVSGVVIEILDYFDSITHTRSIYDVNPQYIRQLNYLNENNIPAGAYFKFRSRTLQDVKLEVKYLLECIKDYKLDVGVWAELYLSNRNSPDVNDTIIDSCCDMLTAAGYRNQIGLYCSVEQLQCFNWINHSDRWLLWIKDVVKTTEELSAVLHGEVPSNFFKVIK